MHETTLTFGPDEALLGTVTSPAGIAQTVPPLGVLLFNAGVIHRVGAHRLNVKLARALAAHGVASLRFDLHGMGDSARAEGALPYKDQVVADLRAAMDALQRTAGAERFALVGFCSGAMPSYWTAQVDSRVGVIVLYDALNFATARSLLRHLWARVMRHGFGPAAWSVWLRAATRAIAGVARSLQKRWFRRPEGSPAREATESGDRIDRHVLGRGLLALARRGTGVVVLSAGADFSAVNYPDQLRHTLGLRRDSSDRLVFRHLADIDHAVTTVAAQRLWIDAIKDDVLALAGQVLPSGVANSSKRTEPNPGAPRTSDASPPACATHGARLP